MKWMYPALFIIAGLAMVTLPDGEMPTLAWRAHFGVAMWAFGAIGGAGLGTLFKPGQS